MPVALSNVQADDESMPNMGLPLIPGQASHVWSKDWLVGLFCVSVHKLQYIPCLSAGYPQSRSGEENAVEIEDQQEAVSLLAYKIQAMS